MTDSSERSLLNRISTQWSQVTSPVQFVARYASAIHNYLRALLADDHDADEAAQEFLAKVSQHGFERVTLDRGRFRDYLIVSVRNTALNVIKRKQRERARVAPLSDAIHPDEPSYPSDDAWIAQWKRCLLDRAWRELFTHERKTPGNLFHTVLKARSDNPGPDDATLASQISRQLNRTVTPDAFRKQLSRGRRKFAEIILEEVVQTLENPTPERVEDELNDTGILEYLRPFLPPDWRERGCLTEEPG